MNKYVKFLHPTKKNQIIAKGIRNLLLVLFVWGIIVYSGVVCTNYILDNIKEISKVFIEIYNFLIYYRISILIVFLMLVFILMWVTVAYTKEELENESN